MCTEYIKLEGKVLFILHLGIEVDYRLKVDCFPEGKMTIRHLLLLWTGDHPAQCEVCKSKSSGSKKGCRRCKLQGDYFLSVFFSTLV